MPPVSNTQFTDLATVKRWISIQAADVGADTDLTRMITMASSAVKRLTNRPIFIASTITETIRGNNRSLLVLGTQPVTSVTSVTENGILLTLGTSWYQGSYRFNSFGLIGIDRGFDSSYDYVVNYTGGFALDSDEAYMAEQAVLSMINFWWKRKAHADQLAQSLGQQLTAKYSDNQIPPEAKLIIDNLKMVA